MSSNQNQRVFRQSLVRFSLILGFPATLCVVQLVRMGMRGLDIYPPAATALRVLGGYGPLLLAGAIAVISLYMAVTQGHVVYRVTPTHLYVRRWAGKEASWPLATLYVSHQTDRVVRWLQVADGRRTFRVHRLFLPHYEQFCQLLLAGSRTRRRVDEL